MNFIQRCGIKCFHWLIGITIAVAWLIMIAIGYMALYPFNPITFNDTEFPVITKEVKNGDNLLFEVDSCKHMAIQGEVQVSYVNGLVFDTPTVLGGKMIGCENITVSRVIPEQLPPGDYQLRVVFRYKVSHLQERSITKFSERFTVLE
jgi:hypothetical protein